MGDKFRDGSAPQTLLDFELGRRRFLGTAIKLAAEPALAQALAMGSVGRALAQAPALLLLGGHQVPHQPPPFVVSPPQELGGEANEPMPVPAMGWFATCKDPHGNEFGLWQNDTSAPAPTG